MKKFLFFLIAGFGLCAVGFVIFVVMNINPIIEKSVNTFGPELTDAPVSLAESDLSFLSGEGELRGLFVGNPKGYKSPHAFKLGSISVKVDKASLTSDRIIINHIIIDSPDIIYELAGKRSNIDALVANIKKKVHVQQTAKQERTETGEAEPGGQQKLQIDNFILKNAKVSLAMALLEGKGMTVPIADIHIKDIGKPGDDKSPAEAIQAVATELNRSITAAAKQGIGSIGNALRKQGEDLKKQMQGVGDGLKKMFNQ